MATPAERRVRFLFCLNIGVLAVLGPAGLLAPGGVAAHWFGDSRSGATARLMDMSPPSGGSPLLSYQMLGAWWGAIALVSLLGLRDPLKYSPIILIQIGYKLLFLATAIAPLALKGRWSAFPLAPAAFFFGYLVPLFACAPWSYLLLKGSGLAADGVKLSAAKAE